MKMKLLVAASTFAIGSVALSGTAFAQSTGQIDFDETIIVSGKVTRSVAGVETPDTSRAKQVLDQAIIGRQAPGQTVNDIINLVPGVSFQNNDPFGSAGGTLTIRGFDASRISQTFDGLPLNDTGNYALYSNQQLDPELIEQVNVNLGSTDVDSPTAAATGSTVNYRTRKPSEEFGVRMVGSAGEFDFMRVFGSIDTGVLTSSGLRAFIAASSATNDTIFGGIGEINKKQINARIYQPLGDNGDFISIAAHYNQNRNNFFGSQSLRSASFPDTKAERDIPVARCTIAAPVAGAADPATSCGSAFDYRYNPSNTGNIRLNSRFTLADGLILTIDPSIQYTKANGGGTLLASERFTPQGLVGFIQGSSAVANYFSGNDINGDGDTLDTVRVHSPSQTETWRLGVISSLRYDIDENNVVRLSYSYDRGRHRQTGEAGLLAINGFGAEPFPVDNPLLASDNTSLQKRNRLSYAILHQVSGEYRGTFGDLTATVGVRMPFFRRNLTNFCFATSSGGNVACFGTDTANATYDAATTFQAPQQRVFNYNKPLPNIGFTYRVGDATSIFGNYSQGLQVPGTDNLYNSFFFARDRAEAKPDPETTHNFDLGFRVRSGRIQAQASAWYTIYNNRLASAYDVDLDATIFRNLGRVDKYGLDGSVSYMPVDQLSVYVFGSYLWSKIKNNVITGETTSNGVTTPIFAQTAGKREGGAPVYTFGTRVQGNFGPFSLGAQAKRTGPRFVNDQNLPVVTNAGALVYPNKTPAYTLVDLDARLSLEFLGLNENTFFQLNVSNLFDEVYVGGFNGAATSVTSVPFAQVGAPRTVIGTISVGF
ncbi:TonB-dependent receptor [Novosphingobium sp.]|uniref:TonB-dependent receptor n=1 Tax=Novosphingobium sp. TaxID=1874826 RepID=UPI0026365092|nr:TonB-dependent receptor [Novosphingobium sp.]